MRKLVIAGNWKMYKTLGAAVDTALALKPLVANANHCEVVIAPVFTAIKTVADRLEGSNIRVSGQDCSTETEEGAHTGEVLASMLKEEGLSTSVGRTVDPVPATNHVLDAKSLNVRVWAQNAVFDPEPGRACGYDPPFSAVEQTQYVVAVNRRHPLAERQAKRMFASLWNALAKRGYTVARRQMPCLPLPNRSRS